MFCLDTNAVIFAINRRRLAVAARLEAELSAGTKLWPPAVVPFELGYGIARSDRRERSAALLAAFLSSGIAVTPFDAKDARHASDIRAHLARQGPPIGHYDLLIAAQARCRGATPVTANGRGFELVPGLALED